MADQTITIRLNDQQYRICQEYAARINAAYQAAGFRGSHDWQAAARYAFRVGVDDIHGVMIDERGIDDEF